MAFPDGVADFRSDTVTRPTGVMRRAMADAEVGDDVYGEDPTVNLLEEESAAAVGKETAVFVPSGTMGNQLAVRVLTRPGDEIVCVEWAHLRNYEMGGATALSGVGFRTVHTLDGRMTPADLATALGEVPFRPQRASLLAWENTHNASGGTIVPVELMEETSAAARRAGLSVHLDGARIWNAVAATGESAKRFAAVADTVQFCFSKGLGAPVGSILCGPAELMEHARYERRRLGGGMRQVGILAAAARVALADRDRLVDDHLLAARLAAGLASLHPAAVDLQTVDTNMVMVAEAGLPVPAAVFQDRLAAAAVKVGLMKTGVLRFVTHRDVDDGDVDRVLAVAAGLGG